MWITPDEFDFVLAGEPGASTASATTYEKTQVIDMGRYTSMVGIVTIGENQVTTSNLWVLEASTASTTLAAGTPISAWKYRYGTTGDTLSTTGNGATTATVMSSTEGTQYLVMVKSDDLDSGYPYVMVSVSVAGAFRPVAITYVGKPRYPQNTMLTALS